MKAELKPEELRLGNWVKIEGSEPFQITGIFKEWIWALIQETDFPVKDLQGIELSEERLLKAGFEKGVQESYSLGYKKKYNVYRKGLFTYNGIQSAWWYNGQVLQKQPEYVHQLQNLFFYLEGNELIFNHG